MALQWFQHHLLNNSTFLPWLGWQLYQILNSDPNVGLPLGFLAHFVGLIQNLWSKAQRSNGGSVLVWLVFLPFPGCSRWFPFRRNFRVPIDRATSTVGISARIKVCLSISSERINISWGRVSFLKHEVSFYLSTSVFCLSAILLVNIFLEIEHVYRKATHGGG